MTLNRQSMIDGLTIGTMSSQSGQLI